MSHSARRRALIIAGSSVLAGFALVAPAYAATSGHSAAAAPVAGPRTPTGALVQPGGISHLVGPRTTHTGARNSTTTGTNWSGYAATGGTYTSVSSSWTEPTGTCSSGDQYSSFWVGLDGYSSDSVEQAGSEVDCDGHTPEYYSWYEMYPANPVNFSNTVKPGDKFTGSVTYPGGSSFPTPRKAGAIPSPRPCPGRPDPRRRSSPRRPVAPIAGRSCRWPTSPRSASRVRRSTDRRSAASTRSGSTWSPRTPSRRTAFPRSPAGRTSAPRG